MRFTLTFKTPDVLDQLERQCRVYGNDNQDDDFSIDEDKLGVMRRYAKRYIDYGEIIHLEFDIEKDTVEVII